MEASAEMKPRYFQWLRIPYDLINVLPQPRKTFEDIGELGDDVADKNLHYPPLLAAYDEDYCQQHLDLINKLWRTSFQITDLVYRIEKGIKVFYVLIDGERRFRSCKYLMETGCSVCREKYGPGGCYQRHFGDLKIETRFSFNIDPHDALDIQASANIHRRVPPVEEARFYEGLFNLRKSKNPKYTLTEFARKMGRNPNTIRQALKFCELPMEYQEYVAQGHLAWGLAKEIVRLHIQGLKDKELDWWMTRAITGNYKIEDFRKLVSEFLYQQNNNQVSLFDQAQEKQMRRFGFRQVVERHYILGLWSFVHYLNQLNFLFENGKLGLKDSPFSERSPIKLYRQMLDIAEQNVFHFEKLSRFPKLEAKRAQQVIDKSNKILSQLEKNMPEEEKAIR